MKGTKAMYKEKKIKDEVERKNIKIKSMYTPFNRQNCCGI